MLPSQGRKTGDECRPGIRACGFWINGQQAFFDVRVFDPSAYANQTMQQCFAKNEKEKKRNYNERIINVDNGSFTALIFSIHGGMARECSTFYSRLSELIANKKKRTFFDHSLLDKNEDLLRITEFQFVMPTRLKKYL